MSIEQLSKELFKKETPLKLESGKTLGPIQISYETYGNLNNDKSNGILVCHALTGDAHAMSEVDEKPGWWQNFIGPNKPLDTNKYFIICSNVIGGCKGSTGPESINPETNTAYGLDFPIITVEDMVNAQKTLIDSLEIEILLSVIGGSMGGMQALQWSVSYPHMVKSCIPIASTAQMTPQALAFDAVGREAIKIDPKWNQGSYHETKEHVEGLSIARMIGHITYLSEESMAIKFGRNLQEKKQFDYDHNIEFQIESYLKYQGEKFIDRFDPNSYIYLTKAISYFDLEKKYGSLEKAFSNTNTNFLIIAIKSDWIYTPEQSKDIVKTLMKMQRDVTYCELDSPYGHDAFLVDNKKLSLIVSGFLAQLENV